jgi:hypothetical protein
MYALADLPTTHPKPSYKVLRQPMLPKNSNLGGLIKQGLGTAFNKITQTQVEIVVKCELPTGHAVRKTIIKKTIINQSALAHTGQPSLWGNQE